MRFYLFLFSVFYFLFVAFITSCKNSDEPVKLPPNILSQEKYTRLLVDFALAESAANMNVKNVGIHKIDSVYAFDPLLENNVRQSQYDSTVYYYSQNGSLNKKIYENVLVALTEIQTQRNNLKKDSVSK